MSSLIRCPSCDSTLQVPEDRLGRSVKCGRCETVFTATASETRDPEPYVRREEPSPRPDSGAGRRRPRYDDDDDDFDDRPRRRRPRYDDDEFDDRYYDIRRRDGYSRSDARSRVAGPAIMLMVYGVLLVLAAVCCLLVAFWAVSELTEGPKNAIRQKTTTWFLPWSFPSSDLSAGSFVALSFLSVVTVCVSCVHGALP
jgi:predicted Zn finger-like uncharacterized protein